MSTRPSSDAPLDRPRPDYFIGYGDFFGNSQIESFTRNSLTGSYTFNGSRGDNPSENRPSS